MGDSQPDAAIQTYAFLQAWSAPEAKPPAEHPLYLLDTKTWTVRLFTACWKDSDAELRNNGYGAVSYSWGTWKDRSRTAAPGSTAPDTESSAYPSFDIGQDARAGKNKAALSWNFPVVSAYVNGKQDRTKEQFTIDDVRRMLDAMGKRFVWWDWACIPQGIPERESDHPLRGVAQAEMNKMRFVYPYSTAGTIWAHNVDWNNASPLKTAIEICCENLGTLEWQNRPVALVYKVVDALSDAHLAEEWFRSLWCFQEGVLFTHPDRNSRFKDAFFRDIHGNTLRIPGSSEEGRIGDLVDVATAIVRSIVSVLKSYVEAPDARPNYYPPGEPQWWSLKEWSSNPAFEQTARGMINRLMATGLVNMAAQHPLSLLNARLGRIPAPWSSNMDVDVNTVIGALEVNVDKWMTKAEAIAAPERKKISEKTGLSKQEIKDLTKPIDDAMVPPVREGMLSELFRYYQWRMLLLATPRRVDADHPLSKLKALWSDLVRVPRYRPITNTPYTSLETFLKNSMLGGLYNPPRLRYEGDAVVDEPITRGFAPQGELQKLRYDPELQLLILQKGGGKESMTQPGPAGSYTDKPYKLFQLDAFAQPLWTKCMFYGQSLTGGSFVPTFQFVSWEEKKDVLGSNLVLVPLEYIYNVYNGEPGKNNVRLRCIVLSNFGEPGYPVLNNTDLNGLKKAVFVGVVDIEGDGEDTVVSLDKGNLVLDGDVVVY